jgi:hypothetical protein
LGLTICVTTIQYRNKENRSCSDFRRGLEKIWHHMLNHEVSIQFSQQPALFTYSLLPLMARHVVPCQPKDATLTFDDYITPEWSRVGPTGKQRLVPPLVHTTMFGHSGYPTSMPLIVLHAFEVADRVSILQRFFYRKH